MLNSDITAGRRRDLAYYLNNRTDYRTLRYNVIGTLDGWLSLQRLWHAPPLTIPATATWRARQFPRAILSHYRDSAVGVGWAGLPIFRDAFLSPSQSVRTPYSVRPTVRAPLRPLCQCVHTLRRPTTVEVLTRLRQCGKCEVFE